MIITRTFDLLDRFEQLFLNKEDVLCAKQNGKWIKYSTKDYINTAHKVSYGLLALGFQKGDKIITISNNRPEWNFVDMGMAMIGVVHVPIFTSLSSDEYEYILEHSDSKMVFVSDKSLYLKIFSAIQKTKKEIPIYSFDTIDQVKNLNDLLALGKESEVYYKEEVNKIKNSIHENDFATLIYTSGTTGVSKGVMLSHKNMVQNCIAANDVFKLTENDKFLSILPLCHVGGRMGNYQTQYSGCSLYYGENLGTLAVNMKEIEPTGFEAVPRILEKVFDSIIAKGNKLKGVKKAIFFWAVDIGLNYKLPDDSSWWYNQKLKIADKLIFSKWRAALGGKLRLIGCGGAALQPRLERVFWAAGIKVINMYGLTETSPIITINRTEKPDLKLGTVGSLIDGVEIKFTEDGEILCKGHNVMLGYYKNPDLTEQVLDSEGWFHTGDIGYLDENKFLVITDRKKEMFKLSSGKFIAPQVIENKLKESIAIEQIMVFGEHEKFASALIYPNFSYIKDWCEQNNLKYNSNDDIIQIPEVYSLIQKEIKDYNNKSQKAEHILKFKLVADEWSPVSGELSPTLKLKRKAILEKYKNQIEQIYSKQLV
jgi:long-chain acyl-CoA synthetase